MRLCLSFWCELRWFLMILSNDCKASSFVWATESTLKLKFFELIFDFVFWYLKFLLILFFSVFVLVFIKVKLRLMFVIASSKKTFDTRAFRNSFSCVSVVLLVLFWILILVLSFLVIMIVIDLVCNLFYFKCMCCCLSWVRVSSFRLK